MKHSIFALCLLVAIPTVAQRHRDAATSSASQPFNLDIPITPLAEYTYDFMLKESGLSSLSQATWSVTATIPSDPTLFVAGSDWRARVAGGILSVVIWRHRGTGNDAWVCKMATLTLPFEPNASVVKTLDLSMIQPGDSIQFESWPTRMTLQAVDGAGALRFNSTSHGSLWHSDLPTQYNAAQFPNYTRACN